MLQQQQLQHLYCQKVVKTFDIWSTRTNMLMNSSTCSGVDLTLTLFTCLNYFNQSTLGLKKTRLKVNHWIWSFTWYFKVSQFIFHPLFLITNHFLFFSKSDCLERKQHFYTLIWFQSLFHWTLSNKRAKKKKACSQWRWHSLQHFPDMQLSCNVFWTQEASSAYCI